MKKLLSVIIPIYNVEKYIERCLDSLLISQEQFKCLDIVIINDGTKDNSAIIAKEYEKKYPEVIRVIDQENRGHGGAWNHGTELAIGKYCFYLDSDDWVTTNQFEQLVEQLKSNDTDLVFINSQTYYAATDSYVKHNIINLIPNHVYDLDVFDWIHTPQIPNVTYITHCVYKTDLLKPHLPIFLEKVHYDDIILEGLPILLSRTFVHYDLCVYNYYKGREGQSFDPKVRAKHFDDVTTVLKSSIDFVKINTPRETSKRREFGMHLYESFIRYHYYEIANEPINYSKTHLMKWDTYVRENHSQLEPDKLMKCYRNLPFVIFIVGFKINRYYTKGLRWIKKYLK